jgi:hypothetical protein
MESALHEKLRILVCDDEREWEGIASAELEPYLDRIEIVYTRTPEEARSEIRAKSIQMAFVDIYFPVEGSKDERAEGIELSRYIERWAPSCHQVLMTRFLNKGYSDLIERFGEFRAQQPLIVNKASTLAQPFLESVNTRLEARLRRRWTTPSLRTAAELLVTARRQIAGLRVGDASEVERELDGLFFDLFNEAMSANLMKQPPTLRVEDLHRGRSGSVVLETYIDYGRDRSGEGVVGTRCVVKLGSRASIQREESRYRSLVRMGVPSEFRVELIETAYGDSLGAICYSFAGGTLAKRIASLDELLADTNHEEDDRAMKVLRRLYDGQHRSWDSIQGETMGIATFYAREFSADFGANVRRLRSFLEKHYGDQFDTKSGIWTLGGSAWTAPNDNDLGSGKWKKTSPTCLVHGDLHGGNILVNEHDDVTMIDFANTALGPRFADTAALASTIRLETLPDVLDARELHAIARAESVLRQRNPDSRALAEGEKHRWFRLARELDGLSLANITRRHADEAVEKELAATQLCYALSIFGLPWWTRVQRTRLALC